MTNIVNISSNKAQRIRTMSRVVNLIIGLGLPVMIFQFPPAKPTWLAMGFLLSIILVTFSIVGLWPKLKVSFLGHVFDNQVVHTTTSFVVGMTIIVLAIANPPVLTAWFAFFMGIGTLLVFDAIISLGYRAKISAKKTTSAPYQQHHNKAA